MTGGMEGRGWKEGMERRGIVRGGWKGSHGKEGMVAPARCPLTPGRCPSPPPLPSGLIFPRRLCSPTPESPCLAPGIRRNVL